MKFRLRKSITAGTIAISSMIISPVLAQDQAAPPLIKQLNNGNRLSQNEAESLRDELFYQRAIHAYITMLPALNVIGIRDGSEAAFGKATTSCRSGRTGWTPAPGYQHPTPMSFTR